MILIEAGQIRFATVDREERGRVRTWSQARDAGSGVTEEILRADAASKKRRRHLSRVKSGIKNRAARTSYSQHLINLVGNRPRRIDVVGRHGARILEVRFGIERDDAVKRAMAPYTILAQETRGDEVERSQIRARRHNQVRLVAARQVDYRSGQNRIVVENRIQDHLAGV